MEKKIQKPDLSGDHVRCPWCLKDELYMKYHDEEWGVPVHDENKHFEFLVLETFQAGLSWYTILKKRGNFRKAFEDFIPERVAGFGEDKFLSLMSDTGIIRNKMKIAATISNARAFLKVQQESGSFDRYIWSFTDNKTLRNDWKDMSEIPAMTALSDLISADLKKRGFKFVGSTIVYSHLQAIGVVNDHLISCFRHSK